MRSSSPTGARPRRAQVQGVEALTPSEERIARLAIQGDGNRRIAETLFLTKNTVEWPLRTVPRKLGISSRSELHEALDKAGLEVELLAGGTAGTALAGLNGSG